MPACEARLAAQVLCCCGSTLVVSAVALAGTSADDVGSKSVLLSRMNVFCVTSGASSVGMSSRGPEGVTKESASGHASTRSEASAA